MSNRVDELERKVKDLQAAVNGLTEELVESKERIRQLENTVEVDDPALRAKPAADPDEQAPDAESESESESESEPEPEPEPEPEQRFVDAEEHEAELEENLGPEGTDEEAKAEEEKEEETESEQGGSDIIVA